MKNELKSFLIEENYGPKNQKVKNIFQQKRKKIEILLKQKKIIEQS